MMLLGPLSTTIEYGPGIVTSLHRSKTYIKRITREF